MPRLARPDGVELHVVEKGEGQPVVLAPYWSGHPGVFEQLLADLSTDHRIVSFDARGTGGSTRRGPYDMETDAADLEAVVEAAGSGVVVISIADGCNRAVRLGARRPDLVAAVLAIGGGPIARTKFAGGDAMVASDSVVNAFLEMLARDYRGALRTLLADTNEQMSEEEVRGRVAFQTEYCPQVAAASRVRAWAEDDPSAEAAELGKRLWILTAPDVAGPWLPSLEENRRIIERVMPEAHVVVREREQGPVSRPDLTAEVVRRITAPLRVAR
jgi:pimeloyl-ACP methyl ester carboxylesterase